MHTHASRAKSHGYGYNGGEDGCSTSGAGVPRLVSTFPDRPCSGRMVEGYSERQYGASMHSPCSPSGERHFATSHSAMGMGKRVTPVYSYSSSGDRLPSTLSSSLKRPAGDAWKIAGSKGVWDC